jgi:hypothetical protein
VRSALEWAEVRTLAADGVSQREIVRGRLNRLAEGCSALPVLKTGWAYDSYSVSATTQTVSKTVRGRWVPRGFESLPSDSSSNPLHRGRFAVDRRSPADGAELVRIPESRLCRAFFRSHDDRAEPRPPAPPRGRAGSHREVGVHARSVAAPARRDAASAVLRQPPAGLRRIANKGAPHSGQ